MAGSIVSDPRVLFPIVYLESVSQCPSDSLISEKVAEKMGCVPKALLPPLACAVHMDGH